jgi:hypothetical protein
MGKDCMVSPLLAIIEAVRDGALAWSSLAELTEATGLELEDTQQAIDQAISDGLIVAWQEWYTLSLECAEAMGVQIEDYGIVGRGRWVEIGHAGRTRSYLRRTHQALDADSLDDLVDPGPDPAAVLEATEYVDKILAKYFKHKRPLALDGIQPPSLILIGPAIVWREAKSPATCWRCEGRALRPWSLCLCCLRWGMDEYFHMGRRKIDKRTRTRACGTSKTRRRPTSSRTRSRNVIS